MRSYAQYRKDQLVQESHSLSIREAIARHFDVLRLELVEASQLPPMLFESSHLADMTYERARKEDHEDIKEILEYVLTQYQLHFYDELLAEADAVAASPFVDLENQMRAKVKEMIATLKSQIGGILSGARPVGDEEPAAPGAAAGPGTAPTPGGITATPGVTPTVTHTATAGAAGSPGSPGAAGAPGVGSPAQAGPDTTGGFNPAPPGSIRPSDGFLAGLKRTLYDPIAGWVKDKWRNFRRRWHNDPMREHSITLERLFLENFDSVMSLIDDFEKNLLDYLSVHFKQLATGGDVPPPEGPDGTNTTAIPGGPVDATATSSSLHGADAAAKTAADPDDTQDAETPLDALPADQRHAVELKRSAAAVKGAELLGIKVMGIGPKGAWNPVKPNGLVDAQTGQPIEPTRLVGDKQVEAGWARVRNRLYYLIFNKIAETDPQVVENLRAEKRKQINDQGQFKKGSLTLGEKKTLVNSWLGIQPVGSKSAILDMLSSYHKKQTQVDSGHTTPPVSGAGDAQQNEPSQEQQPNPEVQPNQAGAGSITPPGGNGASQSQSRNFEAEANSVIQRLKTEQPQLWSKILHHVAGEDQIRADLVIDFKDEGDTPETAFNFYVNAAKRMPDVPQSNQEPSPTHEPPDALNQANQPEAGPAATAEPAAPEAESPPATDNAPKYRKLAEKIRKEETDPDMLPYLNTDHISDAELKHLFDDIDWNDPHAKGEFITRLIHHNFSNGHGDAGSEGPADQESPNAEEPAPEAPGGGASPTASPAPTDTVAATKAPTHHEGKSFSDLVANPEYKKLTQKYARLVGDNLDNEDLGLEAAVDLEDKIRARMDKGEYDVNTALAYLQKMVDLEIERGNDPDNYLSKHQRGQGVAGKGDVSEPLPEKPGTVDDEQKEPSDEEKERLRDEEEDAESEKWRRKQLADRKKKNEGFNHILNRFRQLIHN